MRALAVCLAIAMTASADTPGLAGRYVGDWKSGASGTGGALRFTLEGPHVEAWKAQLTFILGGVEVPTVMREVRVDQTKIELTYDFDTQGATLRSHITGDWDGAAFKGKFETTMSGSPVDGGTWTAVREKEKK
jgi:hypothetical protein